MSTIKIYGHSIGPGHPPYIIAEACVNHQGDMNIAKKMVHIAHEKGADAIKFQMHVIDDEMLPEVPISDNFDEPLWKILEKTNLSVEDHQELKELCDTLGIHYLCTPFSMFAADILETDLDIGAFKTGSGEMTNIPLLRHIAAKGRPMIVSTGMCNIEEIEETVSALKPTGVAFALTHCVSIYPCPYNRVNLHNIPRYQKLFGIPIGLSCHTPSIYTAIGAIALGAAIIEKHFTLDRSMKGPDHMASIEPDELGEMVKGCRAVYEAGGSERCIFPEEEQIVAWARESVVSVCDIAENEIISADMVSVKRPTPGEGAIAAKHLPDVIGKTARISIKKDRQIMWSEIG